MIEVALDGRCPEGDAWKFSGLKLWGVKRKVQRGAHNQITSPFTNFGKKSTVQTNRDNTYLPSNSYASGKFSLKKVSTSFGVDILSANSENGAKMVTKRQIVENTAIRTNINNVPLECISCRNSCQLCFQ